ncbi:MULTISPECIES: hypothetical protein [Rhodanobacteraceae]|uniref:hypothetical protein n=1 Tax=Rhodanobacteraceae TaxID=1775411 RepID=UPI00056C69F1|nr:MULTISPECIES: hypothetical protein [Rhodanobacteraceae]
MTPKRQPGGRHGGFVAHGVLYPGSRQKLGMPDHEEPTSWADEYYVEADQDVQVWFTYDLRTPGSKYAPGTRQSCGPVDGQFHVDEGADYEVSARVDAGMRGCFVDVKRIVELNGKVYFLPVRVGPRVLPK